MRNVMKSEWSEVVSLGHGYRVERVKYYNDGYIQPNTYIVWHKGEGVKFLWANDHRIKLPEKFKDYLRAYAALKLSTK